MLIDKTDALWPRVSAAFNAVQGPAPAGMLADDFAVNRLMQFIISVVTNYEGGVALAPAPATVQAAVTKVATDFSAQIPPIPKGV